MKILHVVVCTALLLGLLAPVQAADSVESLNAALAKAKYLLRSMQKENQALKADTAKLEQDLARANEDLAGLTADKKALEKDLADALAEGQRLGDRLDATERQREAAYQRIEQLSDALREHRTVLARTIGERNALQAGLGDAEAVIEECEFKNRKLFEANVEMAKLYEFKGQTDAVLQGESLTGLKQAEIEGVLEEYRRKIEAFHIAAGETGTH